MQNIQCFYFSSSHSVTLGWILSLLILVAGKGDEGPGKGSKRSRWDCAMETRKGSKGQVGRPYRSLRLTVVSRNVFIVLFSV